MNAIIPRPSYHLGTKIVATPNGYGERPIFPKLGGQVYPHRICVLKYLSDFGVVTILVPGWLQDAGEEIQPHLSRRSRISWQVISGARWRLVKIKAEGQEAPGYIALVRSSYHSTVGC